jgi:hypothetical protein
MVYCNSALSISSARSRRAAAACLFFTRSPESMFSIRLSQNRYLAQAPSHVKVLLAVSVIFDGYVFLGQ